MTSERVKRGLSPEALARKASISVRVLKSVEDGNLDWIGTPILIRGFIRNYCTALGLDAAPLLDKYSSEIRSFDQQGKGIQRYKMWVIAYRGKKRLGVFSLAILCVLAVVAFYLALWVSDRQARLAGSPQMAKDAYPQEELPSDLSKRLVPPSPVAGRADSPSVSRSTGMLGERPSNMAPRPEGVHSGASVGSTTAPSLDRGVRMPGERPSSMAPKPEEVHLDASASAIVPAPRGQANQETGQPPVSSPAPQKHVFSVEAVRGAWIQVKIDGKAGKGMTLKPGRKRTWEAEKGIEVVLGNAQGVHMTWDDRPVQIPDKQNRVLRFSLPDSRYLPGE